MFSIQPPTIHRQWLMVMMMIYGEKENKKPSLETPENRFIQVMRIWLMPRVSLGLG